VSYAIVGELSDARSKGLAMFAIDLAFDGGPLAQAATPTAGPMTNFVSPVGLSNPAGYGGTPVSGTLHQIGGAQNTIKNTFAPQPTGTVILDVAQAGSPEVLVTGELTAPLTPGTYTLAIELLLANVVRVGSDGNPFWHVSPAGEGLITDLVVIVVECTPPVTYCVAKQNSQGCLPAIASSGTPSLAGPDDFHITASNVINAEFGTLFWSLTPDMAPFMGGFRCVDHPIVRTPNQSSGGSPPPAVDCTGSFDFHVSQLYLLEQGLTAGTTVYSQYWYRDPSHPDGTGVGLTDALRFTVCL
jgi:hypothetical protein